MAKVPMSKLMGLVRRYASKLPQRRGILGPAATARARRHGSRLLSLEAMQPQVHRDIATDILERYGMSGSRAQKVVDFFTRKAKPTYETLGGAGRGKFKGVALNATGLPGDSGGPVFLALRLEDDS